MTDQAEPSDVCDGADTPALGALSGEQLELLEDILEDLTRAAKKCRSGSFATAF